MTTIQIKDEEVLAGLMGREFHHRLIKIVCWIAEHYGLYMTESHRHAYHIGDTHATDPVRAIDLRERFYADPEAVAAAINAKFQYDPERPKKLVAKIHENRNTKGLHFHVQSHPNTVERTEKQREK